LCTWLALGLKTQVWNPVYLAAAPLLLVQFAAFFGFSMLLATIFRSSIASALGALLCWAACAGINSVHNTMSVTTRSESHVVGAHDSSQQTESHQLQAPNSGDTAASSGGAIIERPAPKYNPALVSLVGACYWILPKPVDIGCYVFHELRAGDFVAAPVSY